METHAPLPVSSGAPAASEAIELLSCVPAAEQVILRRAIDGARSIYGEAKLESGEPVFTHVLHTALILAGLKLDVETLVAALLQATPRFGDYAERHRNEFGPRVAQLLEGAARMSEIQALTGHAQAPAPERAAQLEGLRKMLLAMVQDVRVVLIALASRTRALRYALAQQTHPGLARLARETLDIFAPLANRLGVWQLKWELEDLAFRALEPDVFAKIVKLLDEKRSAREQYLSEVIGALSAELERAGIRAEVSGRPKHIYSIYKKMRRKGIEFQALYDVRAVRILVNDLKDCYGALGVVHAIWQPVPKEFDDYIAKPKRNDYRSLHTAVIGPEGKALEVQIRTFDMHQHAELGVAAHWRYKEGGKFDSRYHDKIAWLRQILAWKEDVADASELASQFKTELFQDTVYVLTPQGKVIDLPRGATPLDFAYAVHTELGHRCRGARVDGALVPLNFPLANGQTVEVIAAKEGGPSRDWLNTAQGYLRSSRARAKVRQWFKNQNLEASIAQGRAFIERELQRLHATGIGLDKLAEKLRFNKPDELLAAAGRGELAARQIQQALKAETGEAAKLEPELPLARAALAPAAGKGVLVVGVDKLLTVLAKCCKPAPPDAIIGFVTRGRGVMVHRASCANVQRLDRERLIESGWGSHHEGIFPVDVVVDAADRQGLLRDISEVFSREKINVTAVNTLSKNIAARMHFTLEINSIQHLNGVLKQIREVSGVISAQRK
ncbi:MAG TPA: bifunctional (p)ppGpp synthetase/guanosine-3',5'-bis(diphosphate) 3'-pyrophosphohydrolase [Burkholderiales bacterium]|nr:bifunctional (p)ppGpp synthetase/guanosine-3',5'-bis(diphosphate) 3'-pyrophosphohydrolase [Burkholderiales bacterium]